MSGKEVKKKMIAKRVVLSSVAVIAIAGMFMFAQGQAHAQTPATTNPLTKLAQMISQKFGLDQGQVQSVVDQFHSERKAERQTKKQERLEERLTQLVKDGKITDAQKQAIIQKHNELATKYASMDWKNLTVDERKQKMQQMHDEIASWAKSQGLDLSILMPGFGMKGMWGHRMGWFNK